MIQPVSNHCLIEIADEFGGVLRNRKDEDRKKGKVLAYSLDSYHLTASTGLWLGEGFEKRREQLEGYLGKTVLYQQFADEGQTFEEDGKKYALVYWWRIMGVYPEVKKMAEVGDVKTS